METEVYDSLFENAENHWWNQGRKRIVKSLLRGLTLSGPKRILDLGCGVGTNLRTLSRFGTVWGADPSEKALAYCRRFFSGPLDIICLPDQIPYDREFFDIIVLLDVLEHIANDHRAMAVISSLLKPGGKVILTVPALSWLWSQYDVHAHHFRRYGKSQLKGVLEGAALQVSKVSYYNFFLFPCLAMAKVVLPGSYWKPATMHSRGNIPLFRRCLETIFASERYLLPFLNFPIGCSLLAVATKPA